MKVNLKKGFTLIELLIVIAIIGILAVALLPSILSAPASARDAAKQAALGQIAVALEQYNASAGGYPAAAAASTGECMTVGGAGVAQTLLKPYFKTNDVPVIDQPKAADANSPAAAACSGYLYCKFSGNRYYLGVAQESPATTGKGRYTSVTKLAGCDGTGAVITNGGLATNTYGILN
jgi:prepilin-type N-terminal cleavage/methylation domain-containing protein